MIFSAGEWRDIEQSVGGGLTWLSGQQASDGRIGRSSISIQPAITSLATMAFLSRGHVPGEGPHGAYLEKAIDYVISSQDRYGFFVLDETYRNHGGTYSHAISGVMLAEALGMTGDRKRNERIAHSLRRAITATIKLQQRHSDDDQDRGGWRYIKRREPDSDLSVSTWHILFLRAAKNAGFDIPESLVADACDFVGRCYRADQAQFSYLPGRGGTITMTGSGVLCLFLAGQFDDRSALKGVKTLEAFDFTHLSGEIRWPYYTCYHCSQAASLAGGEARERVLRGIATYLLGRQRNDGSWPPSGNADYAGECYATSMAILSLTPSYQILPIYQQ